MTLLLKPNHHMIDIQMNKEKIIKDFILKHYSSEVDNNTDLIETGIIDSMGIIDLVSYLEETLGISFLDEDITIENFGSIDLILDYLKTKD